MRPTPTPLERAPDAVASWAGSGQTLFLKREDVHELGAFKWRGALPTLSAWRDDGVTAVVTASTGNHGAATAWAAAALGLDAIVFVPEGAARSKLELIASFGATLRHAGRDIDDAKDAAREHATASGLPFFEDGVEPAQYEGYRAIAAEVVEQLPELPAAVVVPLGNGALLGGIALELRDRSPATLVVGVQSQEAPVMVECWRAGRVVESDRCATFADGLAVRVAIPHAVGLLQDLADRMVLVSDRDIAGAVGAYAAAGIRAEGAAGAGLAALPQLGDVRGSLVVLVTGRNIDDDLWRRAVDAPKSFPA